jgi:hypothetical protein
MQDLNQRFKSFSSRYETLPTLVAAPGKKKLHLTQSRSTGLARLYKAEARSVIHMAVSGFQRVTTLLSRDSRAGGGGAVTYARCECHRLNLQR